MKLYLLFLAIIADFCLLQCSGILNQHQCKPIPIEIKACRTVYNFTSMPNLISMETQNEADIGLKTFTQLIEYGCSRKLQFFLCSVYTPMCDNNFQVGPCRPLCEHVRDRCFPVMKAFNIQWPKNLECSRFPESNQAGKMCMKGPDIEEVYEPKKELFPTTKSHPKCQHLRNSKRYVYVNSTGRCALLCNQNDLFNSDNKYIAEIWMGILSGLCFISTLFTCLTFAIDPQRFKYPERPVVFLAMCYMFYSFSYFIRLIAGRSKVVCDKDLGGEHILIQKGLNNKYCAITFLIQYFFGTASSVWWVMLTVTWLLATWFKWGDEAIQRQSCYLHITAWLVPTILTLIILFMPAMEADELLGMCNVGHQRVGTLMAFVISPSLIFLVIGVCFLFTGVISLLRIRRMVKNDGIKTHKLEVLMVRIGLFSMLYIVPAGCVVACNIYEYIYRDSWHKINSTATPNIEIFMLKTFMSLVVGITSGFWIWSVKTLESWRMFFRHICCGMTGPVGLPWTGVDKQEQVCMMSATGMMPPANFQTTGTSYQQPVGGYIPDLLGAGRNNRANPRHQQQQQQPFGAIYTKANNGETVI